MASKSIIFVLLLVCALQCNAVTQEVKVKFTRCYLSYNYTTAEIRALTASMDEIGEAALNDYYKCYFVCWFDVPRNGISLMNDKGVVTLPKNTENRDTAENCINNLPEYNNMCDKAYEVQRCLLKAKFE